MLNTCVLQPEALTEQLCRALFTQRDKRPRSVRPSGNGTVTVQIVTSTASRPATVAGPSLTLDLLDRYFSLDESHDRALAYKGRAEAYLTLGRLEEAIVAFEATLKPEAMRPNVPPLAREASRRAFRAEMHLECTSSSGSLDKCQSAASVGAESERDDLGA